jgi:hypothetical protein
MSRKAREEPALNHTNGTPLNGHPRSPARTTEQEDDETDENIFLFVPNLIGMRCESSTSGNHMLTTHIYQATLGSS